MGATPCYIKEAKTGARNSSLFIVVFDKTGLEMMMRLPRGLLKLTDNVGLHFSLFPSGLVDVVVRERERGGVLWDW